MDVPAASSPSEARHSPGMVTAPPPRRPRPRSRPGGTAISLCPPVPAQQQVGLVLVSWINIIKLDSY